LSGRRGFEQVEGVDVLEVAEPAQVGEDQAGRQDALVGGDGELQAGALQGFEHCTDAGVGGGLLVAFAVVAGLEAVGQALDEGLVVAAGEELQGFDERRADDALVDGARRRHVAAGEGFAVAGEDGRGGVDEGAVEVEEDVLVAGHGLGWGGRNGRDYRPLGHIHGEGRGRPGG
jgi:hypothetical protein